MVNALACISVVIPALNEEKTISKIVSIAKSTPLVEEVIVVDDNSFDKTVENALKAGAKIVKSKILGKGYSMHEGLLEAKCEIVAFIDADLSSIESNIVQRLCEPIVLGEADFVKSTFGRKAGRITELVAKPLLEMFFPEALKFTQPLAGMVAGKKELLKKLEFANDYGIDIGLLIDMLMQNAVIEEIDIGFINHKMKSWQKLKPMALQVSNSIIHKAIKYDRINFVNFENIQRFSNELEAAVGKLAGLDKKLIVFDMDGVLLDGRFIFEFAKEHNFLEKVEKISSEPTDTYVKTKQIALLLKGFTVRQILEIAKKIPLMPNTKFTINELKRRGYTIGIITDSYRIVADYLLKKIGADFALGNELEMANEIATGEVKIPSWFFTFEEGCKNHGICKLNALKRLAIESNTSLNDTIAVGDNTADVRMIEFAGKGIAFQPKIQEVEKAAKIVVKKKNLEQILRYC